MTHNTNKRYEDDPIRVHHIREKYHPTIIYDKPDGLSKKDIREIIDNDELGDAISPKLQHQIEEIKAEHPLYNKENTEAKLVGTTHTEAVDDQ